MPSGEQLPMVKTADDFKTLPRNIPGKYFVTDRCDGCAFCALVAPDHFEFDRRTNTDFVCRQPVEGPELQLVMDAVEDCPVSAIYPLEVENWGVSVPSLSTYSER